VSGGTLIERHSAFPVFASLLTAESRALWKDAQLAGETNAWARYFPPTAHGDLFAAHLRLCPGCVAADLASYGLAYWRVQHQLYWVVTCQAHGEQLHDRCGQCGALFPQALKIQLPGTPCTVCGSSATRPIEDTKPSAGRRALQALLVRAGDGMAPELAPEMRVQILREAFAGKDAQVIAKRFMAYWHVKGIPSLEKTLGCKIKEAGLMRLIASGAGQVPVSVLLSLMTLAKDELGDDGVAKIASAVSAREASLRKVDADARQSDVLSDALQAQVRALSLPAGVIDLLLRNDLPAAYMLIGGLNLASIVDRLPMQHRGVFRSGRANQFADLY